jgi:hypothetical protein
VRDWASALAAAKRVNVAASTPVRIVAKWYEVVRMRVSVE